MKILYQSYQYIVWLNIFFSFQFFWYWVIYIFCLWYPTLISSYFDICLSINKIWDKELLTTNIENIKDSQMISYRFYIIYVAVFRFFLFTIQRYFFTSIAKLGDVIEQYLDWDVKVTRTFYNFSQLKWENNLEILSRISSNTGECWAVVRYLHHETSLFYD